MNSLDLTKKIYSDTTKKLSLDFTSTFNNVNEHQSILHQYSMLDFDCIPLLIEVIGIIITIATCIVMHLIMKKSYENIDRPTIHHLIHDKYYNKQLNEFLNEHDRKRKILRDVSNKREMLRDVFE
ncbi:Thrombin-like enzyme catroxobin-1 [Dirofilaria immitis]